MLGLMMTARAAALLLSPLGAAAQAPPPSYGTPIGHDAAMKAIAAAEAEAKKNNWPMVIAVVDSGSRLVAFSRMDGAQLGSIDIAMGKAMTSNNLRRPTKDLQELIGQGGANLRLLAAPGVTPLECAVPIVADGKIIGTNGGSGAASNPPAQSPMAAAAAAA